VETIKPGAVPIYIESLTNLYGLIYGVAVPPLFRWFFTLSRKVDWLSPQFASALLSRTNFPKVTIQTHSGHVVTLQNAGVLKITKAGFKNTLYYCPPTVGPGMEAITWKVARQS
jgi:hypothetical protein